MAKDDNNDLKKRIAELSAELRERENDINKYRNELVSANNRLESLIAQMSSDIKLAQAIQNSLIPTEFPNIQGFEFSTKFVPSMISGGDYFDIFSHENKLRFGVVLISCSGHTLSSLFLSILLKLGGQMEARRGADPHLILQQVFSEIKPFLIDGGKIDLFYGLIDRRNYEMSYCQLGHMACLHQTYPNGEIKNLESTGGPIDAQFTGQFKVKTLNLSPRDKLILCTHGIIDAKNLSEDVFGFLRLGTAIGEGHKSNVHEIRNQIFYELQKHTLGQAPKRDQTGIVIEVKNKVIKLAKN